MVTPRWFLHVWESENGDEPEWHEYGPFPSEKAAWEEIKHYLKGVEFEVRQEETP